VAVFGLAVIAINAATVRLFGDVEYWFAMVKVVAIVVFILLCCPCSTSWRSPLCSPSSRGR
jgi:L-asparagine transporter-like permease